MPHTDHRRQKASTASAARVPMRSRCWEPPNTASRTKRASAARMRPSEPMQHDAFLELVEHLVTRYRPFVDRDDSWGTRSTPPSGNGWRIADFADEHATRWERRRLLPAWGRSC